jgi:hypothetical protein
MASADPQARSTKELVNALDSLKHGFGRGAADAKIEALQALKERSIRQASLLAKYHEALCYLQAYPDSRRLLAEIEEALSDVDRLVREAREQTAEGNYSRLDNAGIAGSTVTYPFSYPTARWLAEHFPEDVSIDWDAFEHEDRLLTLLPQFVSHLENEALDDPELETKHWLALGRSGKTDLTALIELLGRSSLGEEAVEAMYELLDLPVAWRLRGRGASRTLARLPGMKTYYQTRPLSRRKADLARHITRPMPEFERAGEADGCRLINASLAALGVRLRELVPLMHADPRDVWTADMGRGIVMVLIGVVPSCRMPVECTYSFLLLKNGVPLGYGCNSALADRSEVAVNIFETFRRGESAYVYAQVLRAVHHVFHSTSFLVDRYQIGYENSEGIRSGASWFYYKMGFRPVEPDAREIAEAEVRQIAADGRYRSPAATLRRLAKSDMLLSLSGEEPLAARLNLGALGRLVTSFIGREFGGDRSAAVRSSMRALKKALPVALLDRFSTDEVEAIRRFSPLVVQIPDLAGWRPGEKEGLVKLMAAKGGTSEIPYARRMAQHRRFVESLCVLSRRGEDL